MLLEKYPHLHFEDGVLSFYGVLWDDLCIIDRQHLDIERCYPMYEAECPGKFLPEIIPENPGCLGSPDAQHWHILARNASPSPPDRTALPIDEETGAWNPLEEGYDLIQLHAFGYSSDVPLQDLIEEYPYLYFYENAAYFNGTLMSDFCTANDVYYETGCTARYEEQCPGIFKVEIIPGGAGCLHDESDQRKGFYARFSIDWGDDGSSVYTEGNSAMTGGSSGYYSYLTHGVSYSSQSLDDGQILRYEIPWNQDSDGVSNTGSFIVPEGARSFQLVSLGNPFRKLIDPNGNEHMPQFGTRHGDPSRRVRFLANSDIVITQSTSDIDYSYYDVVIPGEWTYEVRKSDPAKDLPVVVVIKTRNDTDDKLRLKIVNATTHSNEAFAARLDRMVELAERLGINMEVSAIEKIPHRDNPHDPPSDFCERFCSSDEAVVLITEPGGWSSPGPGIALKLSYNTHFLVGAEVATYENDSVPSRSPARTAALRRRTRPPVRNTCGRRN